MAVVLLSIVKIAFLFLYLITNVEVKIWRWLGLNQGPFVQKNERRSTEQKDADCSMPVIHNVLLFEAVGANNLIITITYSFILRPFSHNYLLSNSSRF